MTEPDFTELAGRVEGLTRAFMHAVAALEDTGQLDGPKLANKLRSTLPERPGEAPVLTGARKTLHQIAQALDEARHHRSAAHRS
jgi:hypothetical protein